MSSPKHKVRHVKFTAREMASDGPSPSELRNWPVVGRGRNAIFAKPSAQSTVVLAPDVAEVFPSSAAVNEALRGLIKIAKQSARRRKKTA